MLLQVENTEPEPDLTRILRDLGSRTQSARLEGEVALAQLSAHDLVRLADMEEARRKLRRHRLIALGALYFAVALALVFWVHNGQMFNVIGAFTGLFAATTAFSSAHKHAIKRLSEFDDLAGIGALILALDIQDFDVQIAVRKGLSRLLPRLKASDSAGLNADHRRALVKHLMNVPKANAWTSHHEFVIAALQALGQVGDETFVTAVERLASGVGAGVNAGVRDAAKQCLPALKVRIENEHMSRELLRGSSHMALGHPSESLLRPAQSHSETDSGSLLRPQL